MLAAGPTAPPRQSLGFQPSQLLVLIPLSLSPSVHICALHHWALSGDTPRGVCLSCVSASLSPGETAPASFSLGHCPPGLCFPGAAHVLLGAPGTSLGPWSPSEKAHTHHPSSQPLPWRPAESFLICYFTRKSHWKNRAPAPFPTRRGVLAPGIGEGILWNQGRPFQ